MPKHIHVYYRPIKKNLYIRFGAAIKFWFTILHKKNCRISIAVGDNPNDICLTKNGKYLFVANANDNSVSVIDVMQKEKLLKH